ncbi:hypothetical protein B7486_02530 [cyanobacterium TDX16]|nr:hypothetical protein B7486_02530 [cyanobacterium TDX16]
MNRRDRKTVQRPRQRSAFTLVELIVSMTVGVIVTGSAGWLIWSATDIRSQVAARVEVADTAATALECMVRYVREIQQDECPANPTPCLMGRAQVGMATADELRFGNTGFRLSGAQVEMTTDNALNWHPVARDVSEFSIAYFARDGSALASFPLSQADRESMRLVQITLALTRSSETVRLRTAVYLRSFMDEVTTDP